HMIDFQDICKDFKSDFWSGKVAALKNISFKIQEGKITGLLGINGAGKTTLMKILMRFIKSSKGEITFDKKLGKNFQEILSNLGYLPEHPYFYPYLTGYEFVQYMGALSNIKKRDIKERTVSLAERLKLSHALDRKIRGYSKGMQQRLGFIASLVHNPALLILDEPFSGLDPIGRWEIKNILYEFHKKGGSIFFSSHIISDVEEICHDIVVLQRGELLYDGSVEKLIEDHIGPNFLVNLTIDDISKITGLGDVSLVRKDETANIFSIPLKLKETFLNKALENGAKIKSLHQDRPSLEEIIYKIKK
ncbi:MAG: ABC transporter ATP-binding protein, partial [Halobacteriovoraceae bacterium]|nr:ABC transporter ATP-binding protein [Halobacteriovoraceae bacterium]